MRGLGKATKRAPSKQFDPPSGRWTREFWWGGGGRAPLDADSVKKKEAHEGGVTQHSFFVGGARAGSVPRFFSRGNFTGGISYHESV